MPKKIIMTSIMASLLLVVSLPLTASARTYRHNHRYTYTSRTTSIIKPSVATTTVPVSTPISVPVVTTAAPNPTPSVVSTSTPVPVIVATSTPAPVVVPVTTPSALQLGAYNVNTGTIQVAFNGWVDNAACFSGQTTFIYWENYGYSLDSIINGSQDANIKRFSAELCPNTILALFHEMDGNWDSWDGTVGTNSPAKVIAAYQHIHDIIGNKVRYAWVINNSDVPDRAGNRPADYYPGNAYVDIVGVDGFDWGGTTFAQAINPNYNVVKGYGKPVWITSFGTAQGSNQAAWVTDAIAQAKALNIGALLYFSQNAGTNFTLNSTALAAFHQ